MEKTTAVVICAGDVLGTVECFASPAPSPIFENEMVQLFFPTPSSSLVVVKKTDKYPEQAFELSPPFNPPEILGMDHFQLRRISDNEVQFVFREGAQPGLLAIRYLPASHCVCHMWKPAQG